MISNRSKNQNGIVCGFQPNAIDPFLLLFVIMTKKLFELNIEKSNIIFRDSIGKVIEHA